MARTRVMLTICAIALSLVGFSCSSNTSNPVVGDGRTAAVYEPILEWLLAQEPPASTDEPPEWVMFVASRYEEQVDIDVQAAVIDALESQIFVRFIDDRAEAVADDVEDLPVRDDGILVGLGAVSQDGDNVEVYADRYRDADDVEAWLVTLRRTADSWELVGTPIQTDVRPLTADE